MNQTDAVELDDTSVEFLKKEFDNAFTEWCRLKEEGRNRIRFLFSIISVFAGGAGFLFQVKGIDPEQVGLIVLITFSLTCLLSWQTFNYMIIRAINTDLNIRVMARVRRYFVERNPRLLRYLSWQTDDRPTVFLDFAREGLLLVSQILFSVNNAAVITAICFLSFQTNLNILIAIFIGSFAVSVFFLQRQIKRRLKRAKEKAIAHQRFSPIDEGNYSLKR